MKNGVVQDKLWLPGLLKLKTLRDTGFFGQILSVRGEFGYWVFEGDTMPCPAPVVELPQGRRRRHHPRHALPLPLRARQSLRRRSRPSPASARRTSPQRWDENGKPYDCTADDAAYATFELDGGIIAHINASWCVRVRRDDLLALQVDGTQGQRRGRPARLLGAALRRHAAAGLESRHRQPDRASTTAGSECRSSRPTTTPSRSSGSCSCGTSSRTSRSAGRCWKAAKGVQLAEKGMESWQKRQWVDVPELEVWQAVE